MDQLIAIGEDKILEMGDKSFLSVNPIYALHYRNIYTLAQAMNTNDNLKISDSWLRSNEIGLSGDLAIEWDHFRKKLMDSGVYL